MTNVIVSFLVDLYQAKAELTSFHYGNCFSIASMASAYSLKQMLLRVVADGRTNLLGNAV